MQKERANKVVYEDSDDTTSSLISWSVYFAQFANSDCKL